MKTQGSPTSERTQIGRPPLPASARRVPLNLTLAPELGDRAKDLAYSRGVSLSALVDALLLKEIMRHKGE